MAIGGTVNIQDLPVFEELDSPDWGANFDWVTEDLYQRPYTGLYRTSWDTPLFFRNSEARDIAMLKEATHQTLDSLGEYWRDAIPEHCQALLETMEQSTFTMRDPEHQPTKKLSTRRLTTASIARYEEAAKSALRKQLSLVGDGSTIDLARDLTRPAVADFWAQVLSLTPEESSRAIELIGDFQMVSLLAATPEQLIQANNSVAEYLAMMTEALSRGIARGDNDLLTELNADFQSRDEHVRANDPGTAFAAALLDAFHTFSAVCASAIYAMAATPAEHARVREDRSLVHEAFQEGVRLHPAATLTMREASRDFEYRGLEISEGTPLTIIWLIAIRDPQVWDEPAAYRLGRGERGKQVHFGGGSYICAGKNAVRLMVETSIREVTEPGVRVELAGEAVWVPGSAIHEPISLPATIHVR